MATSITPAEQAIQRANTVMSLVAQLNNLWVQVQSIINVNTNHPLATDWSALNTTAVAADGTLGTADGTPNTAHAIDSRVYPDINFAVSEATLANALQVLVDFNSFRAGTAVGANASRPGQIAAVLVS